MFHVYGARGSESYLQSLQDRAREAQPSQPGPESSPHDTAGIKSSTLAPRDAVSNFQSDQSSQRSSDDSTRYHALARSQDGTDVTIQGSHPGRLPLSGNRTYPGDPHHQRLEIGSDDVGSSPDFTRNPLVDNGETFARDPYGKYWYMGPTSSWAFCRRVLGIIGSRMPQPEPPLDPWDLETLNLTWTPVGLSQQPDVANLPAHDYAVFLLSTVQYHLGSLYDIIDHVSFQQQLGRFYGDHTEASRSRFWYCQFLFMLAFGEVFVSTGSSKSIPGINYASRALALIPSIVPLDENSLPAVEALCLASLYLQAVDLRLMAFQLIGQALRLCIIEGWHRHMPLELVGVQHSQRCNTLFWTAYILDREFGTLVGATSSIRDEDITTKLPSDGNDSPRAAALTLQIKLARLTAKILTGVYGVDRNFDGTLLSDTQAVLHNIADVSKDLSLYLETKLQGTDVRTSKVATRLVLAYHHCVVLTTRPLVMCVLQRRLAQDNFTKTIPDGPIHSLLESCAYSALNILRTLRALGDRNLLDFFLPFQLEAAFSSTFLLYVLDAVSPGFVQGESWLAIAHEIFDMMIARGSPAAKLRKRECQRLEQIMSSYLQQGSNVENDDSQSSGTFHEQADMVVDDPGTSDSIVETESTHDFFSWGLLDVDGGFPMSPNEILNLAEELQADDLMGSS